MSENSILMCFISAELVGFGILIGNLTRHGARFCDIFRTGAAGEQDYGYRHRGGRP